MDKIAKTLENISSKVYIVEKWVLMIAVIAVTAVNFVNVIMRYIFKSGLAYCENLSLALFMLLILIGGVKSDSEIRIDVCRFKDIRKKNAFKLISDICSIIALVCLLLGSIALVQHTAQYNQQVATLPITYLQLYSLLIIGSILMLFDHVVVLFKHLAAIQTGVEEEAEQ